MKIKQILTISLAIIFCGSVFSCLAYTSKTIICDNGNYGFGTTSPAVTVDVNGSINATNYISGKKVGVYAYLDVASTTTITANGTYYSINGTFINSPMVDFSAATSYAPGVKYDGTKTQYFEIDWHAAGEANNAATTVQLGVKKNNSLISGSVMATLCKTANEEYALSGTVVVELATNDEIQLVVTADGDGDVINFQHYTTSISEFFD